MILAVFLSAFMLFSVFTVGITYFKMYRIQNIRLNGGDFDAVMYGLTDAQKEKLKNDPDVEKTGITAVAGSADSTDRDGTVNAGLMWADETYWDEMKAPARSRTEGVYPQAENEIMATKSALKECGYEELTVGDTLEMVWRDWTGEPHSEQFRISGIWEGYGDQKVFYVSEAFYKTCGYEISDVSSGRCFIEFKQALLSQEKQAAFIDGMDLGKQQALFFVAETGYSIPIFLGLCGIALCTCLCAYLLIYNILYLSVADNVRYYGLLQTVGMTGRQIRRLIRSQMTVIGCIGTGAGLLLGVGVSFFIIPSIVRFLGVQAKEAGPIQVSFHPAVFLLSVGLTALTILIGSRKPVKMAESVSPVGAAGYTAAGGGKGVKKTGRGRILVRLAGNQLTADKKRSAVIMFSLGTGLSIFLCLVTLIQSQGPRTVVSNYMDMDMIITNDTMKKDDHDEWKQIISEDLISEIKKAEGIKEVQPVLAAEIMVPWEEDFADLWMSEFFAKWMTEPYEGEYQQEYKEHPENFGTFLVGISGKELQYLNENLEDPVDEDAFSAGKTCVLYRNGLDLDMDDLSGKSITCAEYGNAEKTCTFEIAGLTDENYYQGPLLGYPPAVIVSQKALEDFAGPPLGADADGAGTYIFKAGIRYEETYDEGAENAVIALMNGSTHAKDFSWSSKLEELENVKAAQGSMMQVGIAAALILAAIGILNYINTVTGNIQNRQRDLAVLESMGMTERQMDRMMILEGLFFAGGSLLLTATAGLAVTYVIYQSMNYMEAPFAVPLLPVALMALFVLIICIAVPAAVRYTVMRRGSIIERISARE